VYGVVPPLAVSPAVYAVPTTPFGSALLGIVTGPGTTVMVAVPLAPPATLELAVICAGPGATPVTVTVAVFWFCGIVTLRGTVATLGVSEERLTVRPPAGATPPERFSARLDVVPAPTVSVSGEKARSAAIFTVLVSPT